MSLPVYSCPPPVCVETRSDARSAGLLVHAPDPRDACDSAAASASDFNTPPPQAGFLGSLTTMSTFTSEVVGNRDRHARWWSYIYFAATAIAAQAPALIVGATLK